MQVVTSVISIFRKAALFAGVLLVLAVVARVEPDRRQPSAEIPSKVKYAEAQSDSSDWIRGKAWREN